MKIWALPMSLGLYLSARGPVERRASVSTRGHVPWPGSQLLDLEARLRPAMVRATVPKALWYRVPRLDMYRTALVRGSLASDYGRIGYHRSETQNWPSDKLQESLITQDFGFILWIFLFIGYAVQIDVTPIVMCKDFSAPVLALPTFWSWVAKIANIFIDTEPRC